MLARLFVVILLAFSLVGMQGMTAVESFTAIEIIEVVDAESGFENSEATVMRGAAACVPVTRLLALLPGNAEGPGSSPDLGRVFRPPRSLGS